MDFKEIGDNGSKNINNVKHNKSWTIIVILILILTNFTTYIVSTKLPSSSGKGISGKTYDDIAKFGKLFVVKDNLDKFYDGKIDEEVLVNGAIKGMVESLEDPYTVYMDKKNFKEFNTQTEGSYVGIGLQVAVKNDKVVVVAPFEGSPSKKAGILSGDVIEKVDGVKVTGKEYEKAVSMMRGNKNTYVTLTINRQQKEIFDVKVKREVITLTTVTGEMVNNNIGYIQMTMFDENTGDQFKKVVTELKQKGMKGMILDLRQNPGGWLTQAINITSEFVPRGKDIVSTLDKNNNKEVYKSKGGSLIGIPLVVLTDGGTASASEILSGAVRDYNIGTLVGENTFGKGVVQSVLYQKKFGFGDGTALKVTTSKYYTPNGENIHHKGIKPNIEVKYPKELLKKPYNRAEDPQFNKALEVIKEKIK